MRRLHRQDLWSWSRFDEARNIDFNGYAWVRGGSSDGGTVVVDPMELSEHDQAHLRELGGVAHVIVTNSDHTRTAADVAGRFGASIAGPAAEQDGFPIACDRWLADGDELVPGLVAVTLDGSKTPGELALVLEETTLITGDLIRCHAGGSLCLLPDAKLTDRDAAVASIRRLLDAHPKLDAVLVGDGWPMFHDAARHLRALM